MASGKAIKEMRIDKWLKMVRIFKKRNAATEACNLGRVKVNGQVVKAARTIVVGDAVLVQRGKLYRDVVVRAIPTRGLSAKDAKDYYSEDQPDLSEETQMLLDLEKEAAKKARRKYKGRPTKKERRDWSKFQGF